MRACFVFLCLLAATIALSVKSKPHGKHHGLHKTSHTAKEKDVITEEANKLQVLPTLFTFEAKSQDQEDEELSSEGNGNTNKADGEPEVTEKRDKSTAVLLSDDELLELLKKEAAEEEVEERELGEEDAEADRGKVESGEAEGEEEKEERKFEDNLEMEGGGKEVTGEEEKEARGEDEEDKEMERPFDKVGHREDHISLLEETDGSAVDFDYAADSGLLQPLQIVSAKTKPHTVDTQSHSETEAPKKDVYEADSEEISDQDKSAKDPQDKSKEMDQEPKPQEPTSGRELGTGSLVAGKEEEASTNDSASHGKGKTRKQKKNRRARKHSPQREEAQAGQEVSRQGPPQTESASVDNAVHKAKKRRAGKWGPLVGMNPVQIRATVELYPSSRASFNGGIHHPEDPAEPCDNFRCKRGKTCKLDADNKPGCVCQEPAQCPPSVNELDHVCGTDNKTYDTSCELFGTKCNLEGTKRGHKLHLDYTGPCKLIALCKDAELVQFPLRMRDWLKNVLLQLYEHDSMTPGFLTPKQRFRVKKISESERRLHAGDHSVELLAQDFEKNYNMYIYPVHWQFAQLDQHPSDRFLSHSELAPLRVPLVPMEHCTSRFFQECDADRDKQLSFKEWTSCFGIRNDDMDVNLLF